jgi:hypothetical protein
MAVGLILILSMMGRDAHAQWGFDGWGWWGWDAASYEGAALQAAGQFAMGAGIYNLKTAQAMSIDTDTAIKWNDYVAQVTRESARLHAARIDQQLARNRSLYDARQKQLRESPTRRDIDTGDALNAAVADLSDPRLGRSALRAAKTPVPASLIAEVPFINAAERVSLMLNEIRASVKWPEVFDDQRFTNDQKTFDELLARIRQEAFEENLSAKTLREARTFMNDLRARLEAQPLSDANHQKEALRFITACTSLLDLLDMPNIRPALLELRKIQDTMVGNLLGFMHAYNLRFGVATTPQQRQAYQRLFEILGQTRDQLLAAAKLESQTPAPTGPANATNFFQKVGEGRSRPGTSSQPARPRNPQ